MIWFKYLKSTETTNTSSINTNYSYPFCKRYISSFTPRDTLSKDFWLFVNIENYKINNYQTSELESNTDDHSYIVVYEKENITTPLKSVINNNYLYFQTAEEHIGKSEISGRYAIYYSTPNIRKIKSVTNGSITDYQVSTSTTPFYVSYSETLVSSYEVILGSESSYNFSFINTLNDWQNGITTKPGSKTVLSFTGPSIQIYGNKNSTGSKIKLKITGLADSVFNDSTVAVEDTIIDMYNSSELNNVIFYENNSLEERDYIVEIENLYDKNILSFGNKFEILKYNFKYNLYLKLGKELINQSNNTFTLISGIR